MEAGKQFRVPCYGYLALIFGAIVFFSGIFAGMKGGRAASPAMLVMRIFV